MTKVVQITYYVCTFHQLLEKLLDKSRSEFSGQNIEFVSEEVHIEIRRETNDKIMGQIHFQVEVGFFKKTIMASFGNVIIEVKTSVVQSI